MHQREQWERDLSQVITKRDELAKLIDLTDDEAEAIDELRKEYPIKISRHYASLMSPTDPNDPIRRMVVPTMEELQHRPGEESDDVHADEARYQPCPGIVHRYPGKLLLLPTLACASHCRFCFRKGGKVTHLSQEESDTALDYIRKDQSIRDVIITGGEPLILSDDELYHWVSSLRAIPHVEIIRITTRSPIYTPSRITESLVRMLAEHNPLFMTVSFVHPREITPDVERGLRMMGDAGIVMLQQGPLLKGINDDPAILKRLYEKLASLRVMPYYVIWGIHAPGAEHFLVDGPEASNILGGLENKTSGFCVPHLITIARGDKVRMMGWSPEKEQYRLERRQRAASMTPAQFVSARDA
ncbi:MAG: KamA family radical SAM protein, partial [Candidatus Eisenbacteria sp.]|nr:KamA family radical SAM protein [Candidatus Eisenbacteria bacterium]